MVRTRARVHQLLAGACAALAVLAAAAVAAPPADATVKMRMTTDGLRIFTDDADRAEHVNTGGTVGPDGTIVRWAATVVDCALFCIEPADSTCRSVPNVSNSVECTRSHAGIDIRLQGGDDRLLVRSSLGESVFIDVGSGADDVGGRFATSVVPTGRWTAELGSGADHYDGSDGADVVDAGSSGDEVNSFAGDDRVEGGTGNDDLDAGRGRDSVSAGDGDDIVFGDFAAGAAEPDNLDGGAGYDTLNYRSRTGAVFVAKIAATGGQSGENDAITGFERVLGGSGADSILGLDGDGGPGDDVLTGGTDDNRIIGGTGADTIRGFGGDDTLDANDGVADTKIECGSGTDLALLDLRDPNPADATLCERIDRRAVDEERATVIATRSARLAGRAAGLLVQCPRAVGRPCAGRLTLTVRGARPATARYAVRAGRARLVRVGLSAAAAARVRAARGGLAAVAVSRETGRRGAETVTRRIVVRG